MERIHNLLKRQLKTYLGESFLIPPEWQKFIDAVQDAYTQFDTDRGMLERSLDMSSLELIDANAEMRALIQSFPDLLFRIDSTGTILDYKAGSETALYFSPKNISGKKIQGIPVKDVSMKFDSAIKGVLNTKNIVSIDYSLYRKGNEYFYEARLSPLAENQIMVVIRDITKRKQAEEEKENLRVQLLQSQKMEAIGQLAGGVAHDFNNILTVIMGCAHYLKNEMRDDDPLQLDVHDILASTERAAGLVKSLLAFSRKQIMNPKRVNLNEIIQSMRRLLARVISENIELKTIFTDRNLMVMTDPGQIEQALMNLAMNAQDAMPAGGLLTMSTDFIVVDDEYIRMHGYGKPGMHAVLIVSDSGMGMDEKTTARIFEPFFTTKEIGKGTGLGLAMVYGIIKQHDGYINVYSELGKGTTFTVYLPLVEADVKDTEPEMTQAIEQGNETVLLAEDDREVRRFTKAMLEKHGYEVIEAEDGEDAVNKFMANKDRIQLLLFDVIMPRKNGKEAFDLIKKISPGMKALFMSGYTADTIDRKGLMEKGCNLVLKPVSPSVLFRTMREVLQK